VCIIDKTTHVLDINGLTVIGLMFNWGDRVYGQGETKSLRQEKLRVGFLRLTPEPRSQTTDN